LAKRVLRDKTPITRDILNSITTLAHNIELTEAQFEMIFNLEFKEFQFPLSDIQRKEFDALIGSRKAILLTRKAGVYI
jgi:hypothetical protein